MSLVLVPGLRLARRDADHIQLGVDPPRVAVLPDVPEVRRLVADLAVGRAGAELGAEAALALDQLVEAGLVLPSGTALERAAGLDRTSVRVEASQPVTTAVAALLADAGLRVTEDTEDRTVVLVVADAEVCRGHLDPFVRAGTPHLVVSGGPDELTIGPFVVPGWTACVRCVDAHRSEADPKRGLVVEQVATLPALTEDRVDPTLRALALAAAVRDLVTFAEGLRPATWSATIRVDASLRLQPESWLRHAHCGCSWGEELAAG
jgi:hypothetical protein